jgi:hypothetical protein
MIWSESARVTQGSESLFAQKHRISTIQGVGVKFLGLFAVKGKFPRRAGASAAVECGRQRAVPKMASLQWGNDRFVDTVWT